MEIVTYHHLWARPVSVRPICVKVGSLLKSHATNVSMLNRNDTSLVKNEDRLTSRRISAIRISPPSCNDIQCSFIVDEGGKCTNINVLGLDGVPAGETFP